VQSIAFKLQSELFSAVMIKYANYSTFTAHPHCSQCRPLY